MKCCSGVRRKREGVREVGSVEKKREQEQEIRLIFKSNHNISCHVMSYHVLKN